MKKIILISLLIITCNVVNYALDTRHKGTTKESGKNYLEKKDKALQETYSLTSLLPPKIMFKGKEEITFIPLVMVLIALVFNLTLAIISTKEKRGKILNFFFAFCLLITVLFIIGRYLPNMGELMQFISAGAAFILSMLINDHKKMHSGKIIFQILAGIFMGVSMGIFSSGNTPPIILGQYGFMIICTMIFSLIVREVIIIRKLRRGKMLYEHWT
ncbi:MAG: hypothetical protein WDK96_03575 [Candidatus Paceibacterota bacterium]|jgi:hypothetical protein